MRVQNLKQLVVWFMVFTFSFVSVSPAFSGSRIMPTGKVKVYEGKKLVQVLKQESAFPNGALLTTEGKCGVRMAHFYLVAEDDCTFGVAESADRKDIRVDKGVVYFAVTQGIGQVAFLTPAGVMSAAQIRLDAAANGGVLKGYLDVTNAQVQLGVLEGGSMVLSTAQGEKIVRPGKQIILALADPITEADKAAAAKEEDEDDKAAAPIADDDDEIPATYLAGGGALLAAGIIGLIESDTGGGPGPASPIAP